MERVRFSGYKIVEAYVVGLPVIASEMGGMTGLIHDKRMGLHFSANDSQDLCEKVKMYVQNQAMQHEMRICAREEYVQHYSEEQNYQQLMTIYQQAKSTTNSNV